MFLKFSPTPHLFPKEAYPMKTRTFFCIGIALTLLMPCCAWSADEGILTVKTDPEGIEVWLNDKYIGDAPIYEKKVTPGQYAVKLVDPVRRTSVVEQVFIQAGEPTILEKTMTTKFGTLRVTSDPAGADVYLSSPLGKTPFANEFMNPGKYRLEINNPGKLYKPVVQEVLIPRGETVVITKKLEQNKLLDNKALLRLGLGAGAALGFVWAIVEQGKHTQLDQKIVDKPLVLKDLEDWRKQSKSAATKRVLGIVGGSLCIVGFEIVAFF
jgi:hypothetical protein